MGWDRAMTPAAQAARSRSSAPATTSVTSPICRARCARHPLLAAEQGEPDEVAEGHPARHLEGFEGGGHVEGQVGVEEGGVLRRDDEVDLAQHVEGPAAGDPVDRRDDRLPEVVGLGPQVVAGVVEHEGGRARPDPHGVVADLGPRRRALSPRAGAVGQGLGAVDAGAEGLVPGPGEDDHPDLVVAPEPAPEVAQFALHGGVEGVEDVGAVERDPGHAVGLLVGECLEVDHGRRR